MKKRKIVDMKEKSLAHGTSQPKRKIFQQVSLSDSCQSILYGTLLGDGCMQKTKGYANARLSIRHSWKQKEYFDWKAEKFQEIASPKSIQISFASKGSYSENKKLLFQSRALPCLTLLYDHMYKQKRLVIRRRWLNQMSPLSLAVWWCDDGSLIGGGRQGVLCTDGFDEKSVQLLACYLEKVWNIHVRVGPVRRNRKYGNYSKQEYFRLWFNTEELQKWLRLLMPHIPVPSMVYKWYLVSKNSQFQQRWISEMKEAFRCKDDSFMEALEALLERKRDQKIALEKIREPIKCETSN
jgi:hypothetical protein